MEAKIEWKENLLTTSGNDPHLGSKNEDHFAVLRIDFEGKKYFFKTTNKQYDANVEKIIKKIVDLIENEKEI